MNELFELKKRLDGRYGVTVRGTIW